VETRRSPRGEPQLSFCLVLGGASSGKSSFAERLVERLGKRIAVIGTAIASDAEMAARLELHRRSRPADWLLFEGVADLARAVPERAADAVLLESVDGLLARTIDVDACLSAVLSLAATSPNLVAVSSEVGLSLVSPTPSGRAFTESLGSINQRLSAVADEVYLVVAGLPLELKGFARGRPGSALS